MITIGMKIQMLIYIFHLNNIYPSIALLMPTSNIEYGTPLSPLELAAFSRLQLILDENC